MSPLARLRSVRTKLLAGVMLSIIASMLTAAVLLQLYEVRSYHHAIVADLGGKAELLGRASAPALDFNDPKLARENLALLSGRPRIRRAALYQADGSLFAEYQREGVHAIAEPERNALSGDWVAGDVIYVRRAIEVDGEHVGSIEIEADYRLRERLLDYLGILGLVLLVAIGMAWFASFWLQNQITMPIQAMSDVAQRVIRQRDFSLRATKTADDEIGYLVDAFNGMLHEVEERNAALAAANQRLLQEIDERRAAEEQVRRLNESLEVKVSLRTVQLEAANRELEAFSYSVSHDLRAPLRAIDGFSQAVLEDFGSSLEPQAREYLERVRLATQRMGQLIDDLLNLARVSRAELVRGPINISAMVQEIAAELGQRDPKRQVRWQIAADVTADADARLLRIALENLLSNAWKFTANTADACIEFGIAPSVDGNETYFVRDNGVGFEMSYAHKLFAPFQRLHDAREFPGTGIGLATTQRVIRKHGGLIWAQAATGKGATFYFTLGAKDHAQHPLDTAD